MGKFKGDVPQLPRRPVNEAIIDRIGPPGALPEGRLRDPYLEAGSHPDVVDYLWNVLNRSLPLDCRFIAGSWPALAHPRTARIFALAAGTDYRLHVPEPQHAAALAAGLAPTMTSIFGAVTDLEADLGPGWLFGNFRSAEPDWVRASFEAAAKPWTAPGRA